VILDRTYQLELLQALANTYPAYFKGFDTDGMEGPERRRYIANMHYLEEHGLVDGGLHLYASGGYGLTYPTIKAKGMDFLADDGGLSAILGTVTIKIHDDTLKALVELKISNSELPPQDKSLWIAALRELPASSIKHLAMKLLDLGLTHAPNALHTIESILFQLPKG
jgi:hypothetical protein